MCLFGGAFSPLPGPTWKRKKFIFLRVARIFANFCQFLPIFYNLKQFKPIGLAGSPIGFPAARKWFYGPMESPDHHAGRPKALKSESKEW